MKEPRGSFPVRMIPDIIQREVDRLDIKITETTSEIRTMGLLVIGMIILEVLQIIIP